MLQFDLKGIKISVCFYYYYFNTIVFNSLIFWGRLFVTYGIDLVSILNLFWGIEPSLMCVCVCVCVCVCAHAHARVCVCVNKTEINKIIVKNKNYNKNSNIKFFINYIKIKVIKLYTIIIYSHKHTFIYKQLYSI